MGYKIIMATKINILIGGKIIEAELNDGEEASRVAGALPIESRVNTWGDEFYFNAGLNIPPGKGLTTDLNVGDLGYWPEGDCLCVFFGRTPMSTSDKPVPASGVYIVGRLIADPAICKTVKNPGKIRWEKA